MSRTNAEQKTVNIDYSDVKAKLLHRFLYDQDSSAMQILLGLYDLEEKIQNIFPSYVSMRNLKRDVLSFLRRKENRSLLANSLTRAIYDDVNRYELALYLEGYKRGYSAVNFANELEVIALGHFDVAELFERKQLFQYDYKEEDVHRLRNRSLRHVLEREAGDRLVRSHAVCFGRKVLKKKVFTLNRYVDRQLQINFKSTNGKYNEPEYFLTHQELWGLNRKLTKFLYLDGLRIYTSAYWCGVNDLVLRRYHP